MDGLYDQFRIALHQVWRRRWLAMAVAWGVAVAGLAGHRPDPVELRGEGAAVRPGAVDPAQPDRNHPGRAQQPAAAPQADHHLERESGPRRPPHRSQQPRRQRARPVRASSRRLRQRITITAQPDGALEIKASSNISGFSNGQNARTAAATVQGLIDLFIEQNLSGDRRETGQSLRFLDEELRRREVALQQAEQRRLEFEQRFMGVLPGTGSIGDRMSAARIELANLEQQIAAANGALNSMRGQLARDAAEPARHRRRQQHRQRPDRPARRPDQPEPARAAGPIRIPTSSTPAPADRAAAALMPRRSGAAAIPAACPIPPTSRCAR